MPHDLQKISYGCSRTELVVDWLDKQYVKAGILLFYHKLQAHPVEEADKETPQSAVQQHPKVDIESVK